MKKLILLFCSVLLYSVATAQQVKFTIVNNVIKSDPVTYSTYTLPLRFEFSKDFKNRPLKIIGLQGTHTKSLFSGTFDLAPLSKDGETGKYYVEIGADDHLTGDATVVLTPDKFRFEVGDQKLGPFNKRRPVDQAANNGGAGGTTTTTTGSTANPLTTAQTQVTTAVYEPGYLYYDAMKLKEFAAKAKAGHVTDDDKELVIKILASYNIFAANFNDNPLIKDVLVTMPSIPGSAGLGQGGDGFNPFATIGNLPVTVIADGIAKFLVKRSKEELNVAFFSKFKVFLNKYPELKVVFPQTCTVLGSIASYQYAAMLPALRQGFNTDLNLVTTHLIDLRDLTPDATCDSTCQKRVTIITDFLNKEIGGRAAIASLIIADNLIKGQNVNDAIDIMAADKGTNNTIFKDNFSNSMQVVKLISNSFKSNDGEHAWISRQQVKDLTDLSKGMEGMELFLGLFVARSEQSKIMFIKDTTTITLKKTIESLRIDKLKLDPSLISKFKEMASLIANIADQGKQIADLKSTATTDASSLPYVNYANSVVTMLVKSVDFIKDLKPSDANVLAINSEVKVFAGIAGNCISIYYDINSKNYSSLVIHSSALLEQAFPTQFTYKEAYLKYGTFMANIIQAQNSDEVNAAIEAAVLPVGSASIKRETDINISLNAYFGPSLGKEYIPKNQQSTAWAAGITAPVGVAFSWGNIGKTTDAKTGNATGGKSFTAFISLIDVGALASYRIGDNTTDVAAEVKLKNIVSPGLFLYWGFGKCPISLGIGAQLGPQLRQATKTGVVIDNNYYIKYGASLVVDIPLFNFYTKSKE